MGQLADLVGAAIFNEFYEDIVHPAKDLVSGGALVLLLLILLLTAALLGNYDCRLGGGHHNLTKSEYFKFMKKKVSVKYGQFFFYSDAKYILKIIRT